MKTITYYNLSQNTKGRLVYFRSTDIEQKNWHRLLWSVPDEILYNLSQGRSIKIVDKTSSIRGGKIKRIFIPVLNDLLNRLYFHRTSINKNLISHLNFALEVIMNDKSLLKKYTFWANQMQVPINIIGEDIFVEKEENPLRS